MAEHTHKIISGIFILIGIILFIIGIILFELNVQNSRSQPWYVWLLLIAGLIITIIGAIWLALSFHKPKGSVEKMGTSMYTTPYEQSPVYY